MSSNPGSPVETTSLFSDLELSDLGVAIFELKNDNFEVFGIHPFKFIIKNSEFTNEYRNINPNLQHLIRVSPDFIGNYIDFALNEGELYSECRPECKIFIVPMSKEMYTGYLSHFQEQPIRYSSAYNEVEVANLREVYRNNEKTNGSVLGPLTYKEVFINPIKLVQTEVAQNNQILLLTKDDWKDIGLSFIDCLQQLDNYLSEQFLDNN